MAAARQHWWHPIGDPSRGRRLVKVAGWLAGVAVVVALLGLLGVDVRGWFSDVWDALTSDRPYRPARPREWVLEHIKSQAGTHFDPRVVDVFLSVTSLPGQPPASLELAASGYTAHAAQLPDRR